MKGVYVKVQVRGLNLDSYLNILARRGICLIKIRKFDKNLVYFSVKYNQIEKVFAISNELCYNIKVVKTWGVTYPLMYLLKNAGLVVGAILFVITAFLSNDVILDIKYTGSGNVISNQVASYLKECGITEYSRFSQYDLKKLNASILSKNPNLSYVNCTKVGNVLNIDLALADNKIGVLSGKAQTLICAVDGVIEQIKVYRGTALFEVGDIVKAGDELVSGQVEIKEQITTVNVLAVATVIYQQTREYYSAYQDREDEAVAFFEEELSGDCEIVNSSVQVSPKDNGFKYIVTINCRKTLFAG